MSIVLQQPIRLTRRAPLVTVPVALPAQTARILVRLKLPTTAAPLAWERDARARVRVIEIVDGMELVHEGYASGGIWSRREALGGGEHAEYRLTVRPATGFFGRRVVDDLARRRGETAKVAYGARIEIEMLAGSSLETELVVDVMEQASTLRFHSSIAHDTQTSVSEVPASGTTLSTSHTATGSDLAAVAGAWGSNSPTPSAHAVTYNGVSMNAKGNVASGGDYGRLSAFVLAGVPTGAQTVVLTTTGADGGEQGLIVATTTGVDQTTPAGTEATDSGAGSDDASLTVGSVGATDLVIGFLGHDHNSEAIGADQTEQEREKMGIYDIYLVMESQPGSAGGAMGWSLGTTIYGVGFSYIGFALKEATAGGTDNPVSVEDIAEASDQLVAEGGGEVAVSDTADASDAPVGVAAYQAAAEDIALASENFTIAVGTDVPTEIATASDTPAGVASYQVAAGDTARASDSPAAIAAYQAAPSDTAEASDSASAAGTAQTASAADTAVGSDSPTPTLAAVKGVSDSAHASDALDVQAAIEELLADIARASDSPAAVAAVGVAASDIAEASDSAAAAGDELHLRPPFGAQWSDPALGAAWTDQPREAEWSDPQLDAEWT